MLVLLLIAFTSAVVRAGISEFPRSGSFPPRHYRSDDNPPLKLDLSLTRSYSLPSKIAHDEDYQNSDDGEYDGDEEPYDGMLDYSTRSPRSRQDEEPQLSMSPLASPVNAGGRSPMSTGTQPGTTEDDTAGDSDIYEEEPEVLTAEKAYDMLDDLMVRLSKVHPREIDDSGIDVIAKLHTFLGSYFPEMDTETLVKVLIILKNVVEGSSHGLVRRHIGVIREAAARDFRRRHPKGEQRKVYPMRPFTPLDSIPE